MSLKFSGFITEFSDREFWTSATNKGAYSDFNYGWCGDGTLFRTDDLPWGQSKVRRLHSNSCGFLSLEDPEFDQMEIRPCDYHRAYFLCEYVPNFVQDQIPTRRPIVESLSDSKLTITSDM
jgi:hypothetical protein